MVGLLGARRKIQRGRWGNPLEMVLLQPFLVRHHSPVFCCQSIPPEEGGKPFLPAG